MASSLRHSEIDQLRAKRKAWVRIVEQPASKGLRFRYECEGRSAGSIPGANSDKDNKTFPTIKVEGYKGRAVVVVSCVTSDEPYRPHPHSLVGKDGCKKGVCTLEVPSDTMSISFSSLGVQCVKRKEIEDALKLREQIRVDPFQTGFAHRDQPQGLDLNCVRLCFQVFLEGNERGTFTFALKPVVTEPIFDKKAKNDLTICRMTEFSAAASGGKEMLLFCDKVVKDDIQVRFFVTDDNDKIVWEALGDFQPSDVHKQYGIAFRTPRYKDIDIEQPVRAKIQLRRPSDGSVSEPRDFEFLPLDLGRSFWNAKRMKSNASVFSSILALDNQLQSKSEELRRKVPIKKEVGDNMSNSMGNIKSNNVVMGVAAWNVANREAHGDNKDFFDLLQATNELENLTRQNEQDNFEDLLKAEIIIDNNNDTMETMNNNGIEQTMNNEMDTTLNDFDTNEFESEPTELTDATLMNKPLPEPPVTNSRFNFLKSARKPRPDANKNSNSSNVLNGNNVLNNGNALNNGNGVVRRAHAALGNASRPTASTSLFQRIFQSKNNNNNNNAKSSSKVESTTTSNVDSNGNTEELSALDAMLDPLELDRLDTLVHEFARQYMPETLDADTGDIMVANGDANGNTFDLAINNLNMEHT